MYWYNKETYWKRFSLYKPDNKDKKLKALPDVVNTKFRQL